MKVKVFQIRLIKEQLHIDQENLNNFLDSVIVKKTATELIPGQPDFWSVLVFYDERKAGIQERPSDKMAVTSDSELSEDEKIIVETLKQWRHDKATQLQIPNYMVCHNSELLTIAKVKPQNLYDLTKIKGFGRRKTAKFGDDIITVLNSI